MFGGYGFGEGYEEGLEEGFEGDFGIHLSRFRESRRADSNR
jgi:hypothetical protein